MATAQPGFFLLLIQYRDGTDHLVRKYSNRKWATASRDLIAFIEYIFFHALSHSCCCGFATIFTMYPRARRLSPRIQEALDMTSEIVEAEQPLTEGKTKGYVEFKNVTFAYPGHAESPVIRNVSFLLLLLVETVAFIGSTGSGKSTLIQLIPRFYDVTKGQVLIDGIDVREYRLCFFLFEK